MKKAFTYSAIVLLTAAAACNKTASVSLGEGSITFAPASVETRALIEDAAGLQSQTFQVYDFMGETEYINNTIVYNETDGWTYGTPATYKWADGSHKFFGYTQGAGTFASNALSVSKTLTTAEADQVDLLYSDVFTTTAADWKSTKTAQDKVMLDFHHLLSAVSFQVTNTTSNEAVLNSVDVKIPNQGSASVDYSGTDPAVTYGDVTTSGNFITATPLADLAIAQDQFVDVLTQAVATETNYQMVWPQTFEEGSELTVNVKYTMTIPAEEEGAAPISSTFEADVKIPATTWEAGKKYAYVLKITPSDIQLVFKVMPWDKGKAGSINTNTGSINMSNVTWMNTKVDLDGDGIYGEYISHEEGEGDDKETIVDLNENTVSNGEYTVYMYYHPTVNGETYTANNGYYPAQGYFTVNYPVAGLFKIGLIPAYGETSVDTDAYQIVIWNGSTFVAINPEGETITNDTVYFQVRATGVDSAAHKAQINIWFKAAQYNEATETWVIPEDAEWISAYSEIRANYALTIPAR